MPSPEITPAEVFSHELRATRERKGWTQHQLAQELQRLDYHMVRSQITKIESGQRKATLDDVLAIALALGVPPLALVIPRNDAGSVRLAGNVTMSAPTAIAWWREVDVLSRGDAQSERFFYDSMPDRLAQLTREVPEIVAIFRTVTEFVSSEDSPNAGSVLLMIRDMADSALARHKQGRLTTPKIRTQPKQTTNPPRVSARNTGRKAK